MTPTQEDHEAATRDDPFEKIRRRADQGPYVVDTCHGMVGGPAVLGPTGITGFMQGEANQRKAEELARDQNFIWACGYEAAVLAGAAALSKAVRVAVEKDRDIIARMVRRELDAVMNLDIAIRSDAQATPAPDWPPNSWTPPETGEK